MMTCLLLLGSLLAGQAPTATDQAAQADVARLVRQLDAPQLARRDAAEAELLRRGPAILGLLPAATQRAPAEVQQRLGRIRQKLQRAEAQAATQASLITLRAHAIPLSKALAALQEQSGNRIVDFRARFSQPATDPLLKLDIQAVPFWQALDELLDQAGMTVYPFSEQREIDVVAASGRSGAGRVGRACYRGPFRFQPVRVVAGRDLRQPGSGSLQVTLQVAWEPRLGVINLVARMADLEAVDQRDRPLPVADRQAQLDVPITGNAPTVELNLPFQLPGRDVARIARLKGKLTAVMPGKVETFRFAQLAAARNVEKRIAEATVVLEQVRKTSAGCEVCMRVRFDNPGDALASHRTWIFGNEARLEDRDGRSIAYSSYETTLQKRDELGVAFQFNVGKPIEQLAFVYKTPGAIVAKELDYELRDIPLP
jgi:hypothetical protein